MQVPLSAVIDEYRKKYSNVVHELIMYKLVVTTLEEENQTLKERIASRTEEEEPDKDDL